MSALATRLDAALAREVQSLAPYAQRTSASRGRRHPEPPHAYRLAYQRDRDRLVHSSAFRRLADKTQVFTGPLGDYHRTRLTHTLEVVSVARSLARALRLNEDLVEALALLHDLGHPPFGHAGEETLDDLLRPVGGFSHNAQALRIVEELEVRASQYRGLNLSLEVLEGQEARVAKPPQRSPLLEVQVVDAADSVVYDSHDADDAIELGLLEIDELREIGLWRESARRVLARGASLTPRELRRAVAHELIDWQVGDLLEHAEARLARSGIDSVESVRRAGWIVAPSPELAEPKRELEAFLFERVYRRPELVTYRRQLQALLAELFERLMRDPHRLPAEWRERFAPAESPRSIGDYVASLTDRGVRREHERVVG